VIIAPNDPKAMINFAKECQQLKLPYLFDPGMQLPRLSKKDLEIGIKGAEIVIGNDYEMGLINSKCRIQNAEFKRRQVWITTLGEKGSIIEYKGKKIRVKPAQPQKVVDPTGAGDAYRAGFVYGYTRGFDLKTAGQIGSLCAVYTVERYGTVTHKFTPEEFAQRYYQNFKKEINLNA
jgi:adenosine kinase